MRITPTRLPGVLIVHPERFGDVRGYFVETYHAERYAAAGMPAVFVQDNQSSSRRGTIRGLHLQVRRPQAKLIRVLSGAILDVAVDVRVGSPTFGQSVTMPLTAESLDQAYIPEGFAHGFAVLSDQADIEYKCSDLYDPDGQLGILWNDPALAIEWPVDVPVLSDRDRMNPRLADIVDRLPRFPSQHCKDSHKSGRQRR